jgi:hypothetical protein
MKEWTDLVAVVISSVALVFAILAHRRAINAERRLLAQAKTQAFLTFRDRFQQIKRDLPPRWSDPTWLPRPGTDEWRRIELYWQNAFDEWFVPTRLDKEHLQDLWPLFFESAVKSALDNRPLRYVAWALYEQGEFAQYKRDFAEVLERLWGRPLRDADFRLRDGPAEPGAAADQSRDAAPAP